MIQNILNQQLRDRGLIQDVRSHHTTSISASSPHPSLHSAASTSHLSAHNVNIQQNQQQQKQQQQKQQQQKQQQQKQQQQKQQQQNPPRQPKKPRPPRQTHVDYTPPFLRPFYHGRDTSTSTSMYLFLLK